MNRVAITGIGVVSAAGDTPDQLHQNIRLGNLQLAPIDLIPANGGAPPLGSALSSFSPADYLGKANFRPLNRPSQLLASAAQLCLESGGCRQEERTEEEEDPIGLVVGSMLSSVETIGQFDRRALLAGPAYVSPLDFANTVINSAAGQVAIWHKLRGLNSTIAEGESSGLQAIGYACDAIRSGKARRILAGGVEALSFEVAYGLYRRGLLCGGDNGSPPCPVPFSAGRNGYAIAEGASLLLLEEASSAQERGVPILAVIEGHGGSFDVSRGRDQKSLMRSMARSMEAALRDCDLDSSSIDAVSCSANGSPLGDRCEAHAIRFVFDNGNADLPVTAVKSATGEALGASGVLQVADLVCAIQDGSLPPIKGLLEVDDELPPLSYLKQPLEGEWHHLLVNSFGSDGHCGSMVIGRAG